MMSAGDLDGDVFMCIWDEQLVNAVLDENICEPAPVDQNLPTQENENLDGFFDHLTYYMRNDTLGQLSNMHVAICDKSTLGPKDPNAIKVAAMVSVQVDFAKHSLCVPRKDFEAVRQMVTEYPDYLSKTTTAASKPTYESKHVLGQMYRHVNISQYYEDCTRIEYQQSIKYNYLVSPILISYFKDPTQFGNPDGRGLGLEQHLSELKDVYI